MHASHRIPIQSLNCIVVLYYTAPMRGIKTSLKDIQTIKQLRKTGHTVSEIANVTGKSRSIISTYIQGVEILPKYLTTWNSMQGSSRTRANAEWAQSLITAQRVITSLNRKEKMIIAACLYWGEGTKSELSLSNTDPALIKTFVTCLEEFGITKDRFRVTVRIYEDINSEKAINYWANIVGISKQQVVGVNILSGKKKGKLEYGMCRIRVTKGKESFKLLQSLARTIQSKISPL